MWNNFFRPSLRANSITNTDTETHTPHLHTKPGGKSLTLAAPVRRDVAAQQAKLAPTGDVFSQVMLTYDAHVAPLTTAAVAQADLLLESLLFHGLYRKRQLRTQGVNVIYRKLSSTEKY